MPDDLRAAGVAAEGRAVNSRRPPYRGRYPQFCSFGLPSRAEPGLGELVHAVHMLTNCLKPTELFVVGNLIATRPGGRGSHLVNNI